jgi:hypothetical protein
VAAAREATSIRPLELADFRLVLKIWDDPVHVLAPTAVVGELDHLKKSKDNDTRRRTSYTFAVLDRVGNSARRLLRPEKVRRLAPTRCPAARSRSRSSLTRPATSGCRSSATRSSAGSWPWNRSRTASAAGHLQHRTG